MTQSSFPDYDPEIMREFGMETVNGAGQLFGIPLFDGPSLWQLLFRFAINLVFCWLIIGLFYYRRDR